MSPKCSCWNHRYEGLNNASKQNQAERIDHSERTPTGRRAWRSSGERMRPPNWGGGATSCSTFGISRLMVTAACSLIDSVQSAGKLNVTHKAGLLQVGIVLHASARKSAQQQVRENTSEQQSHSCIGKPCEMGTGLVANPQAFGTCDASPTRAVC